MLINKSRSEVEVLQIYFLSRVSGRNCWTGSSLLTVMRNG
jgi:hypothetical protein